MRLAEFRQAVECDLFKGEPQSIRRLVSLLLWGRGGDGLVVLLRLRALFLSNNRGRIGLIVQTIIERRYGCYISGRAIIGERPKFPHPVGIVIGEGVVVGSGCTIYQNVTLGGRRLGASNIVYYPRVGDAVTIFAGAAVLGDAIIGNASTIGANAVVLKSVPDGATAAGVPARILSITK